MVADSDFIVRNLVRVADSRVDPRVKPEDGYDGDRESVSAAVAISREDDGGPRSKGSKRFARSANCILLFGSRRPPCFLRVENLADVPAPRSPRCKSKGGPIRSLADANQAIVLIWSGHSGCWCFINCAARRMHRGWPPPPTPSRKGRGRNFLGAILTVSRNTPVAPNRSRRTGTARSRTPSV